MAVEDIVLSDSQETESEWGSAFLDPGAYLSRIGYDGPCTPTAKNLHALHRAHMSAIPFENVDVALGRGISLEMPDLRSKLVDAGRGGYCFEHNLLFAAALERFGYPVTRLMARVRRGSDRIRYRAHAVAAVMADHQLWLADVGFGDEGLIEPVPLEVGAKVTVGDWTWRIVRDLDQWVLQSEHPDGWFDLYSFRIEQHFQVDFEVSNYYTAHNARSTFVGKLIAMRSTESVRQVLKNGELVSRYPDGRTERTEMTGDQTLDVLRNTFGVRLTDEDAALLTERFFTV